MTEQASSREILVQKIAEATARARGRTGKGDAIDGHIACAVVSVVEAQVAPLRDEVRRLERVLERADKEIADSHDEILANLDKAHEAMAERDAALVALASQDTYTEEGGLIVVGKLGEQRARADAAESALRQVRELAERWKRTGAFGQATRELLAVLDSARVRAADTQPEGAGEAHETLWGIESNLAGVEFAFGVSPNTREEAERQAHLRPGSRVREVRNCAWAGFTTYDTPTAGSKVDTAPEADTASHDYCQEHRMCGCICGCNSPTADTAPESGEDTT